jgi:hypothetical protein
MLLDQLFNILHLHIVRLDAMATAEIIKDEGSIKNAAVTLDYL